MYTIITMLLTGKKGGSQGVLTLKVGWASPIMIIILLILCLIALAVQCHCHATSKSKKSLKTTAKGLQEHVLSEV